MCPSTNKQTLPLIYFYVPKIHWFSDMPGTVQEFWEDHESKRGKKHLGRYSWTLKTYLYLIEYGIKCELTTELPDTGIVVAHRDFLVDIKSDSIKDILLVCIKADREALQIADIHIVQNPTDRVITRGNPENRSQFLYPVIQLSIRILCHIL